MTYVVPHFRYGSLMFYPEISKNGTLSKYTVSFTKMYNQAIKNMWKLPQCTGEAKIKKIMGRWNAEVIYTCSYIMSANKWAEIVRG